MTNREYLNSLSDEEFVCKIREHHECDECELVGECDSRLCDKQFAEWLQAEHKD